MVEIKVTGIAQGVGFRPFIYRMAILNRLVGFVRNRGDAGVEILVEGDAKDIERFIEDLKNKKPPLAKIHNLIINHGDEKHEFKSFSISRSFESGDLSGSVIPPDVSICNECIKELQNPKDRRFNYFFITCVDCGPRYTIIERLPYDRSNITMKDFVMCKKCEEEYRNPLNRRFHAQTIACPVCGPKAYLVTSNGKTLDLDDPIREAGKLVEEGHILAVKGNGGFHIASATTRSEPIGRLRRTKHRSQKPFAIMAKDLKAIRSFAQVGDLEVELLTSYIRPIVLLEKSEDYHLSEMISPGLNNVGVMLPYTGLHYMLFDKVKEPAFVMTSANSPNEPIVTENQEAFDKLKSVVDYFLFHNRKIVQRCDDSVVRISDMNNSIIRRSRGFAPAPIHLGTSRDYCTLGVGSELNVNSCLLLGNRAFLSQHIGDVENLETLYFLKDATRHLINLTKSRVELIACDLHPRFTTAKYAHELGEEFSCEVITVQHHQTHAASLMGEHSLSEIVAIVCDGTGYGSDGKNWGGEIFHGNSEGFLRLGHLQEQFMLGGDLATYYPIRMVAGILGEVANITPWLYSKVEKLPHGEKEIEVIIKQLEQKKSHKTSSCGRVLDAVSALLGICHERTYEGEPAIKLEAVAERGKDILHLKPRIEGKIVNTTYLLTEIFEQINKYPVADLAFSAQAYIARSLAQLACMEAERLGVGNIGFSGGVAYNVHITSLIKKIAEEEKFRFVTNNQVPPGDGGVSFGQTIAANLYIHK
ncbi:MAG: carbamoyltransferase HypF [Candidatus Bathyarchaeota archaeon]